MSATRSARCCAGGDGDPAYVPAAAVTPNMFDLARVSPLLGRTLVEADGLRDAAPVVTRLRPDVSIAQAEGELVALIGRWSAEFPEL